MAYEIRNVRVEDQDELYALAEHLNTVNLPHDRAAVEEIIERSCRSFEGQIADPRDREYVFVLEDRGAKRLAATSMIIAQLGRPGAPYIYFDVRGEEKYSHTLSKHFRHTVLRIGYSYDGPTEIGGLIVHPSYRSRPERMGQSISYARFLFIAARRDLFRDEILAELLPPLEPDGTSHLWEALGRHFTGMSYANADVLSKKNKEFIKSLFPDGDVYASLLPAEAQAVIGRVGAQTQGVEKLLRRIGFRYANRIDPFDGGPHFAAKTDEITLVARARKARLGEVVATPRATMRRALCATLGPAPDFFRCVVSHCEPRLDGSIAACAETVASLAVPLGGELYVLPLE